MPALVQRPGVIAVGREVAAASDGALAVSHLDQGDLVIHHRVIEGEIHEVSEGITRMVELGDGFRVFVQRIIVGLEDLIIVALLIGRVVPALKALGIKGVDMAGCAAGPGHLKAVKAHEGAVFPLCNISCSLASLMPLRT